MTLFNQMRSCSGTFPEVGRLSSMCMGLLEEIRTQGEEAHLVAVGLMEPCIGELLHRILGNCEDHAAGISANQAALVAELSGEGRRHLLGLPNPDTDEPKYIEVMNEKSSGLASTQSRLAAAIAAVSTEGQPKISEAAAISGKLMHHVCLFALLTMMRMPPPGGPLRGKIGSVLSLMEKTAWPADEQESQPGKAILSEARDFVGAAKHLPPAAAAGVHAGKARAEGGSGGSATSGKRGRGEPGGAGGAAAGRAAKRSR